MTDKSVFQQTQAGSLTHDETPENLRIVGDRSFFGQPRGLATLFFTEMWERFSFYGLRALLVLFMTAAIARGGIGFDRENASAILGLYAASVYLASLPGGWIADGWLGLRRAIWWGGVLIALGHLCIALSAVFAHSAFFLGLILIVMGTGLLKPNVSAIVGDLYPEGGARRDAGFSIFYVGINTGAFIAPFITGTLGEKVGWHWGFGAAGIGMLIGLLTFRTRAKGTLGSFGTQASGTPAQQARVRNITIGIGVVAAIVVALGMAGVYTFNAIAMAQMMKTIILTMVVLYFGYVFFLAGLTPQEKKRMAVIFVLFVFAVVFWSAYEQAPTSLSLFARDFSDRRIGGFEVPTSWLQSIPPLFVIVFAPVMAAVWLAVGRRGKDFSSPAKFSFALVCAGVGFLLMVSASNRVIAGGGAVKVSLLWLVASYFFQVIGELALSPVGLSSMTKLAPRRLVGQVMGVWFTASALGNLIAGIVGGGVDPEKLNQMPILFQRTAFSLFIAAAVLAALVIPIRNMMKERTAA